MIASVFVFWAWATALEDEMVGLNGHRYTPGQNLGARCSRPRRDGYWTDMYGVYRILLAQMHAHVLS